MTALIKFAGYADDFGAAWCESRMGISTSRSTEICLPMRGVLSLRSWRWRRREIIDREVEDNPTHNVADYFTTASHPKRPTTQPTMMTMRTKACTGSCCQMKRRRRRGPKDARRKSSVDKMHSIKDWANHQVLFGRSHLHRPEYKEGEDEGEEEKEESSDGEEDTIYLLYSSPLRHQSKTARGVQRKTPQTTHQYMARRTRSRPAQHSPLAT